MPYELSRIQSQVKGVEREYRAVRLATDQLLEIASLDPTQLVQNIDVRDVRNASERLESTYLIRLFAEFETALRTYWELSRDTHPPARDLIESIGRGRNVPSDWLAATHAVREYRNSLVHEGNEEVIKLTLANTRQHLCRFLSRLPENW